jgi:hypothetical protein
MITLRLGWREGTHKDNFTVVLGSFDKHFGEV